MRMSRTMAWPFFFVLALSALSSLSVSTKIQSINLKNSEKLGSTFGLEES
jgi:hypothetical protein